MSGEDFKMTNYQQMCYDYDDKALEEVQKVNPDDGYYPYLQKALEYSKECIKYGELFEEQEAADMNNFNIINNYTFMNIVDELIEIANVLDFRELREYPSYQESEMLKVNLKYKKDIVDLLAYISQVYEKHIPNTEDEKYTKHLLMYFITSLCYNSMVYHNSEQLEYIGMNSLEKRPYLQLFDKLKSEGIHEIEFDRYMYFHKDSLSIERNSVDEFRAKESSKLNQMTQSSQSGCYIATCVYGSYDCPEVWTLRRYRDYTLSKTFFGRLFIRFYYALSPKLVKCFGDYKWFKMFWKVFLDKKVTHLNSIGVKDTEYNDKW